MGDLKEVFRSLQELFPQVRTIGSLPCLALSRTAFEMSCVGLQKKFFSFVNVFFFGS